MATQKIMGAKEWALLLFLSVLWGGSFFFIGVAVKELPPLTIMMLRVSAPHVRRQFRTPWVWFVAPAGVFSCGLMMVSLSNATWIRLVLWTILGLIIYFAYGQRHTAPSKWKVQ